MKINKQYSGLIIGSIFTAGSLLSILTIIVPMITMIPGALFEGIAKAIVSDNSNSSFGELTILLISVTLMLILSTFLFIFWKKETQQKPIENGMIVLLMRICYFIVHPLGFEIIWGLNDFRNDGQLAFLIFASYPISSFAFIFIGGLIDMTKNIVAENSLPQ